MQIMKRFFLALAMLAFASVAVGQVQQARGKATVSYTASAITPEAKAQGLLAAQLKAVEFFYAEAGESEAANFDAVRDKIAANPERYILDTVVLSESDSPSTKQYTVSVRVQLNVANLRNDIKAGSAVGKASRAERSALAFVFVSRAVDSLKSYDTRVTKRADETIRLDTTDSASVRGKEGERIRRGQIDTNAAVSGKSSQTISASVVTETGGTRTRRAAEPTYRLLPSANLNQIFSQVFSRAGFRVNHAAYIEPLTGGKFSVAMVENDYSSGNDLRSSTLQGISQGMRNASIPYIALGTLDVQLADEDASTGLSRVVVTVNAQVLDVTQPVPDSIAVVGPVQYAGVGATEAEARGNALRQAANSAARELTSQLTNLGLK